MSQDLSVDMYGKKFDDDVLVASAKAMQIFSRAIDPKEHPFEFARWFYFGKYQDFHGYIKDAYSRGHGYGETSIFSRPTVVVPYKSKYYFFLINLGE
jgi:hypothetical protein